jgi:hypothetical protein
MTLDQIYEEICLCSEIINKVVRLQNSKMRNNIMKHVGDYRQDLRDNSYRLESEIKFFIGREE